MTAQENSNPSLVVLVHGAWHGAWCWATLQAELDRRGIASLAIDLPGHGASTDQLGDLHGDAAALSALLDQLNERNDRPVVLAGHSYGGAVVTQAAIDRTDIDHLVYLAAFALDANESVMSALGSMDRRDVALGASMIPTADKSATTLDPATAAVALYNQCDPRAISAALPRLTPQPMATMVQETTGNPRQHIESTYVVCAQDRAVHPDHQSVMAQRCTHRVDIDTDHSLFISAVSATANVLEQLARPTEPS
ncbi:MAG: pimeloyl-ACP methyl ester carboxylesterase [Candidatus Aldehydirespiratoraceae bacterium]